MADYVGILQKLGLRLPYESAVRGVCYILDQPVASSYPNNFTGSWPLVDERHFRSLFIFERPRAS